MSWCFLKSQVQEDGQWCLWKMRRCCRLQTDLWLEDPFLLLCVQPMVLDTVINYYITLGPYGPFCCSWCPWGGIWAMQNLSGANNCIINNFPDHSFFYALPSKPPRSMDYNRGRFHHPILLLIKIKIKLGSEDFPGLGVGGRVKERQKLNNIFNVYYLKQNQPTFRSTAIGIGGPKIKNSHEKYIKKYKG